MQTAERDGAILGRTLALVGEFLGVDDLSPDSDFLGAGGIDSIAVLDLMSQLEEEFKLVIPTEALAGLTTVGDVAHLLETLVSTAAE